MPKTSWQPVIGFEIHVELGTASKMFCGCPADHFGKEPNTQTCPVCLGLPGALPVPNTKAIEWCIKLGLALNCRINTDSHFDRKNYFYPDLPKGYQISQYEKPFCYSGNLTLSDGKIIHITRVHMEEDTAKLQHTQIDGHNKSLIDFNRSGVPLVEIVTEPDFESMEQIQEFLKEIREIIRSIGISSADMEKGSMRLEANISVRPIGQKELPKYKIEIKNINSFRFIKKAIEYEINRQIQILESLKVPVQETRGFKESSGETYSLRLKENADDYRYFPEPDIPPFRFSQKQITKWQSQLPLLPSHKRKYLIDHMGLNKEYAHIIVSNDNMYNLFIQTVDNNTDKARQIADFLVNKKYGDQFPSSADQLISMVSSKSSALLSDTSQIRQIASQIITANPKAVSDFKSGKQSAVFFLLGRIKQANPQVDTQIAKDILLELLS